MNTLPKNVHKLMQKLERLPGLGPKSSARIAMFLLKMPASYKRELGMLISELEESIQYCSICSNLSSEDKCVICLSKDRDQSVLNVVEDPLDVLAFEQGADYFGLYHVLGGVISPVNGIGPDDLTIKKLIKRLKKGGIKEVVIATNPNIEGEATAMYIKEEIRKLNKKGLKVSRIAMGLPSGADLEYADRSTLKRAFEGRTDFE